MSIWQAYRLTICKGNSNLQIAQLITKKIHSFTRLFSSSQLPITNLKCFKMPTTSNLIKLDCNHKNEYIKRYCTLGIKNNSN